MASLSKTSPQSKTWSFTCFKYTAAIVEDWKHKEGYDLICFQEEKSPSTGRLHIQGYIRFSSNYRMERVKRFLGDDSAHVETAKGSSAQNLKYCTKSESATGNYQYQHGDFDKHAGTQGKRTDLDDAVDLLRTSASLEKINDAVPKTIIKYGRGIQLSRQLFLSAQAPTSFHRCVIVLWGPSGTGKSQWARQYAAHNGWETYSKTLSKSQDTQWFDGYDGEGVLILDDFTDSAVSFRELLIWTDIYKHRVSLKGAMVLGTWHTVIITSNTNPDDWYFTTHPGEDREPLTRRLDHTFKSPSKPGFLTDVVDYKTTFKGRSPPVDANYLKPNVQPLVGTSVGGNGYILPPICASSPPLTRRECKYDDEDIDEPSSLSSEPESSSPSSSGWPTPSFVDDWTPAPWKGDELCSCGKTRFDCDDDCDVYIRHA